MRNSKIKNGTIERVSGRLIITFTNTGGTASGTYLNPEFTSISGGGTQTVAGGIKLSTLATVFQYFRFTRLRMRLIPSNTNAYELAGYEPNPASSTPTYSGVAGLPVTSDVTSVNASSVALPSVPRKWVVPRDMLCNQNVKWWRTVPLTGEDINFYCQGALWVGSSVAFSNQILALDVEYSCEFKDFIAPANLPLSRSLRHAIRLPASQPVDTSDDDEKSEPIVL